MNNVDVVPRLKLARDLGMRLLIRGTKVRERFAGKHNAPTERIVWSIPLVDPNQMAGSAFFMRMAKYNPAGPPPMIVILILRLFLEKLACDD